MVKNPLGSLTSYPETLDPSVLFRIPRRDARGALGFGDGVPFLGRDRWTCYELAWLDSRGVPKIGIASIEYGADSPHLVESKSLKLFLGSFNFTRFDSAADVEHTIAAALQDLFDGAPVSVAVRSREEWGSLTLAAPPGESIDSAVTEIDGSAEIEAADEIVSETVHSDLLRSLCPVTAQPDWGTVVIKYSGRKIDRGSLLRYINAHRRYQGFHEECCERIFRDVKAAAAPQTLWVGCFYTRRGGIDINPERWLPGTEPLVVTGRFPRQ